MSSGPRRHVILVEDDDAVRGALKFALEAEGMSVEVCQTGEELLGRTLPLSHACLVLDYHLPGVSGLEALAELRRRAVALPAILITTNPKPALQAEAAAAGVPIVEKPLMGDALLGGIRAALPA